MGLDQPFHEVSIDLVSTMHRRLDQRLDRELVDAPGATGRGVEELSDRRIGEELRRRLGTVEVEAHVVAGVFEAERSEPLDIGEAAAQGLEAGRCQGRQKILGAAEDDGEAVLGVEIEAGQTAQQVDDRHGKPLAVIDEDQRVAAVVLLVVDQVVLGLVEEVGSVHPHRQSQLAVERAEDAQGGHDLLLMWPER